MTVFEINKTSRIYCGFKNEERFCELKSDSKTSNQDAIVDSFKKYAFDKDQNDLVNFKYTRSISYSNKNEVYFALSYSSLKSFSISKHNFDNGRVVALDPNAIIGSLLNIYKQMFYVSIYFINFKEPTFHRIIKSPDSLYYFYNSFINEKENNGLYFSKVSL